MTTAHRPTFDPARGGTGRNEGDLAKISQQYSSRDMPSHNTLKYRQKGQSHPDEIKAKDLRREVENREQRDRRSRDSRDRDSSGSYAGTPSKRQKVEEANALSLDADEPLDEIDEDDSDLEDDSDNEAELMAELERIRKERTAEKAAREAKEHEEQDRIRQENILHGNPLLVQPSTAEFKVRRRWDDDVVFKNCARGIDERKKTPNFINDAIRSEFHRKFMEKYIK